MKGELLKPWRVLSLFDSCMHSDLYNESILHTAQLDTESLTVAMAAHPALDHPALCVVSWSAHTHTHTHIYIYAFSRRFYPKRLTLHSSYSFYILSAHFITHTHTLTWAQTHTHSHIGAHTHTHTGANTHTHTLT